MQEQQDKKAARRDRREKRLAAHSRAVTIVSFAIIALLIALGAFTRDRTYSENENRSLAQFPALTLDGLRSGSLFTDAGDYMADQFFARDAWIGLDTFASRALGRRDVNGVYIGKDGYLMTAPETPDTAMQQRKIAAVSAFARNHPDVNVMFMLVPDAAAVMSAKLPRNAPVRDQLSDIAFIESQLGYSVDVLSVAQTLTEHAEEPLYYRTDHHWTSLGAFTAFRASESSFRGDTDVSLPAFNIMTVTDSFEGTLASKSGVHRVKDSIDVYIPQDSSVQYYVNYTDTQTRVTSLYVSAMLEEKDQYTVFFGGNYPLLEIWTTADNGRCLLVFKDSYANCFMQFLTPYYDRIIMIDPRYYYGSLESVFTEYGVTDTLFLYSADTWMTDTTLTDVLGTDVPTASAADTDTDAGADTDD